VNDKILYVLVLNYIKACEEVFWSNAAANSFIFKTVGIQALFDILRKIGLEAYNSKDISAEYFRDRLAPAGAIDFGNDQFRNASGSGRATIRRAIEERLDEDMPDIAP
jgi:hypothetical protein